MALRPMRLLASRLFRNFGAGQSPIIRERKRSIPALPYMERLMSFSLLIFPRPGLYSKASSAQLEPPRRRDLSPARTKTSVQ